ncbi:lasso peptide biosynthesis B2 protein [Streptomyces sp. NPDC048362]|uniref:lasso peptide biosynthesis B2 protein n=1 Tax=Streptomyces sp. NPDC048362 TaxID=3365539 RepID=UPI00371F0AF9
MNRLEVPGYVRESAAEHTGSVLLDARSGRCFAMNPMARILWHEWRQHRDFEAGVSVLARRFPEHGDDRIRQDARQLADALVSRGLLAAAAPTGEPPASSYGILDDTRVDVPHRAVDAARSGVDLRLGGVDVRLGGVAPTSVRVGAEVTMAADPEPRSSPTGRPPTRHDLVAGLLGLLLALLLIRLPFRTLLRVVDWTERRWCRREATVEHGEAALGAVRRAAALYPGRAACLEDSLASLMTLALRGRRAVWCIGTAVDPCRFHAWIETRGIPITAPDEQGVEGFRRILCV